MVHTLTLMGQSEGLATRIQVEMPRLPRARRQLSQTFIPGMRMRGNR